MVGHEKIEASTGSERGKKNPTTTTTYKWWRRYHQIHNISGYVVFKLPRKVYKVANAEDLTKLMTVKVWKQNCLIQMSGLPYRPMVEFALSMILLFSFSVNLKSSFGTSSFFHKAGFTGFRSTQFHNGDVFDITKTFKSLGRNCTKFYTRG